MKLTLFFIIIYTTLNAQLKIGKNPKNISNNYMFQVESKNSKNFIIDTLGNVGIGQLYPTSKLEIQGDIKIVDGSQGTGKVLTSDANGKASWQKTSGNLAANKPTLQSSSSSQWSITVFSSNLYTPLPTFTSPYLEVGIYYITLYQCPGQLTTSTTGSIADAYWSLTSINGGIGIGETYFVPLNSGACSGYTNFIFKVQTAGNFTLSVRKYSATPTFSTNSAGLDASINAKIDVISL